MNGFQENKLLKACRGYIKLCESGEARSIESFSHFKEAILELELDRAMINFGLHVWDHIDCYTPDNATIENVLTEFKNKKK